MMVVNREVFNVRPNYELIEIWKQKARDSGYFDRAEFVWFFAEREAFMLKINVNNNIMDF